MSVPGSASLLMKSYSTWATRRFPTVTRLVMRDPPSLLARWSFILPKAVDPAYPAVTGVIRQQPRSAAGHTGRPGWPAVVRPAQQCSAGHGHTRPDPPAFRR